MEEVANWSREIMNFKTANLNSTTDMRNAVDERLSVVLTTLGYTESHKQVDIKLALGYLSVLAAAGAFLLEKKVSFTEGLPYLKLLLALYFLLTTTSLLYQKLVIKNTVYVGKKGKQQVEIAGEADKFVPEYKMTVTVSSAGGGKGLVTETTLPFTAVFDQFGNLHEGELASWVKELLSTKKTE